MNHPQLFAIGDIHGCADELEELIHLLPLDESSQLVFLGDYVDRGPQSKKVLDIIIDLKKNYAVETLMGNHEAMMLEFFKDPSSSMAGYFILNGGSSTLASYADEQGDYQVPKQHFRFLQELKLYYETDEYFFVHAGVPNLRLKNLDPDKHRNDFLWIRDSFINSRHKWEKTIVHGHTPNTNIEITERRINLDTGCVFNGSLTAMEMHSRQVFQVRAKKPIPHTYLKAHPIKSRVAQRFMGAIPVFIESDEGFSQFTTVNYNEFGLLIVDQEGNKGRLFQIGQILKGRIGDLSKPQINFVGQVVRHQARGHDIAYGIRMLEPLGFDQR